MVNLFNLKARNNKTIFFPLLAYLLNRYYIIHDYIMKTLLRSQSYNRSITIKLHKQKNSNVHHLSGTIELPVMNWKPKTLDHSKVRDNIRANLSSYIYIFIFSGVFTCFVLFLSVFPSLVILLVGFYSSPYLYFLFL